MMSNSPQSQGNWAKSIGSHAEPKPKGKYEKAPQASIADSEGFRLRAACVCLRNREEEEVLLVTSPSGRGWIIPGGKVDPTEASNPALSAVREAREEAGVLGKLGRLLGVFENSEKAHRTTVFVLYVENLQPENVWEEQNKRRRQWFPISVAKSLLREYKPNHAKYLENLESTGGSQHRLSRIS